MCDVFHAHRIYLACEAPQQQQLRELSLLAERSIGARTALLSVEPSYLRLYVYLYIYTRILSLSLSRSIFRSYRGGRDREREEKDGENALFACVSARVLTFVSIRECGGICTCSCSAGKAFLRSKGCSARSFHCPEREGGRELYESSGENVVFDVGAAR